MTAVVAVAENQKKRTKSPFTGFICCLPVSHRVWRGVSDSCKYIHGSAKKLSELVFYYLVYVVETLQKKERGGRISSQRILSNKLHQKKHKHGGRPGKCRSKILVTMPDK
ncbi:hypothetical protein Bca52824_027126 [Brassica carinata]|uniref:Uncharacterized protein n=1 Tax=Brassica carinata TaxID=52824 RepID=A0A8X7SJA7_BRACI|nr:hypothetical protein Bca52824_027126 [Brassica carinata]